MLDAKKVKLGMAPIGWTNDDMPDLGAENSFCQCVSEMALAGFAGTEVGGKYPTDPVVLKKALDLRGLKVCNQWFSSFLISKNFEETAAAFEKATDFLQAMGAHVIGVSEQSWSLQGQIDHPILEGKYVMNDEEWDLLTDGLNRLGQIARAKDIQLTYHHHMGTVVQTEEEIDRFMDSVDPQLVKLLFDSGHLSFCGVDPVPVLRRYADRIGHVHLKDLRMAVRKKAVEGNWSFLKSVREGVFTVPGDGDVDFTSIFDILEESGYEGWVVVEAEQDPAKADPLEYAMKARKYIAEKTGL
jgi:inosose dehydratase